MIYYTEEDDFESKQNFTLHYELIERVLAEVQKPSHTARTRHSLLSLLNDLLVKNCDADNSLESDELVDDDGEYIVFT